VLEPDPTLLRRRPDHCAEQLDDRSGEYRSVESPTRYPQSASEWQRNDGGQIDSELTFQVNSRHGALERNRATFIGHGLHCVIRTPIIRHRYARICLPDSVRLRLSVVGIFIHRQRLGQYRHVTSRHSLHRQERAPRQKALRQTSQHDANVETVVEKSKSQLLVSRGPEFRPSIAIKPGGGVMRNF